MQRPTRAARMFAALVMSAAICLALAACGGGGGSGDATTLLQQTFGGSHAVNSGNLSFSVTVDPSGSRTLTHPVSFSFGGPFQSRGKGKLPASNFDISLTAQGVSGTLGLLSTGTQGYVTLDGASYELPAATFQQLESSFAQLTSSASGGSGSSTLTKLGIDPMHWLVNPSVVGTESIGGTETTHIRAGVNVPALLRDLNTFLQRASSVGVSGAANIPHGISAATQSKIAGEVESPSVDVWTGKSDKTVRRLEVNLTLPVSGHESSALGGLRSASVAVVMQYASLNQPQTISSPSAVQPFSEFTAKIKPILEQIETALGGGLAGSTTSSASGAASNSGSASSVQTYSQCISAARNDIAKMQHCASLLSHK